MGSPTKAKQRWNGPAFQVECSNTDTGWAGDPRHFDDGVHAACWIQCWKKMRLTQETQVSGWEVWTLSLCKASTTRIFILKMARTDTVWPLKVSPEPEQVLWGPKVSECLHLVAMYLVLLAHASELSLLAESLQQPFDNLFWENEEPSPHSPHNTRHFPALWSNNFFFLYSQIFISAKGGQHPNSMYQLENKIIKST